MKRYISSIALLIITLLISILMCACNDTSNNEKDQNEQEAQECEHIWVVRSSKIATCSRKGYEVLQCKICRIKNEVVVPRKKCDYTFSWAEKGRGQVVLKLDCPYDSTHSRECAASIYGVEYIEGANCQENDKEIYTYHAEYDGEIFECKMTEEKVTTGEHQNEEVVTLSENGCAGGYTVERSCRVCGMASTSEYDAHTTYAKNRRDIDLTQYGHCAGVVHVDSCPCGENVSYTYLRRCSSVTLERIEEKCKTEQRDGLYYKKEAYKCSRCPLGLEYEYVYLKEHAGYIYKTEHLYSNGEKIYSQISDYHHESTGHRLEYSYFGKSVDCQGKITGVLSCKDCDYFVYLPDSSTHGKTEATIVYPEYEGGCQGTFMLLSCECGESYFINKDNLTCNFEQIKDEGEISLLLGEDYLIDDKWSMLLCYQCKDCGLYYLSCRVLGKNDEDDVSGWYIVKDIYKIILNEKVLFEMVKDINKVYIY